MEVDLVMWTRNGEHSLPDVLRRAEEAIPRGCVNRRILVDDGSKDHSVDIGESFGWEGYDNPDGGISSGANEALRHVESPFFISLEQDLLLSRSWWDSIPRLLGGRVAVASGMRFASKPKALRELQLYVARKYRGEQQLSSWLRGREPLAFTLGKTLDNTVYSTDVMREVGGFPEVTTNAGVDTTLAYVLEKHGYEWKVDFNVQSTHLRQGFRDELRHQKWYGLQLQSIRRMVEENSGVSFPLKAGTLLNRLAMSPATGLFLSLKTRQPCLAFYHPLIKLYFFLGFLEGRTNG